jgi:FAD/FMN-containing dehydrogenase
MQCAQIALKLPAEQVHFTPDDTNYIWAAQQGTLVPACRVEPTSPQQVSDILSIVKSTECHFAVKSGGHSVNAGASTCADGVTIDLRRFDEVSVSKDRKSVVVGAGSQWSRVYEQVEKDGLLVVGGRVADVGVGGLLTGGKFCLVSWVDWVLMQGYRRDKSAVE